MEAVIALEAQTRIALGGPKTDLYSKAKILQIIMRNVQQFFDIRIQGAITKTTSSKLFDIRHLRCARDITGLCLPGMSRRPIWKDGTSLEDIIAYNLALAS